MSGSSPIAFWRIYSTTSKQHTTVANAGTDQTITLPTNSANLSGSGSYDQNGSITTYNWIQVTGPSTASMSNAWGANNTVSGLVAGTYVFRCQVTDNAGATATDDINVIVNGSGGGGGGTMPVAVAGGDQSISLPTNSAFLAGSGSYVPGGGSITGYSWTEVSGPNTANLQTMSPLNVQAANLVAGTYTFTLTVTSAGGSNSSQVNVTVNGGSTPPPPTTNGQPVAVTGSNQTITLPTNSVFLAGSASYVQGGGTITGYAWSQVSGPNTASIQTVSASNISASNLVAGTYVFKLADTSAEVAIQPMLHYCKWNINSSTNNGPVALAGADQSIWSPGSSVYLMGSGSYDNAGGYITSYTWSQVSGPTTHIWMVIQYKRRGKESCARVYVLLTVTDNLGQVGTDTIQVTVNYGTHKKEVRALERLTSFIIYLPAKVCAILVISMFCPRVLK